MDRDEEFFVNNYAVFGAGTQRLCGYSTKKANAIREKYKEKGVYLLPNKKLAENNMPLKKGAQRRENLLSPIQLAVASLDPLSQEEVIEMAKHMPEPKYLMDQAIAIQQYRVKMGLKNEVEQGRLLDNTESAIGNLVNMIQAKNTIEEGQEVNINVNNSISALLDEFDDKDEITIDIDNKSVNDILEAKK